jgi:hypothetical protein
MTSLSPDARHQLAQPFALLGERLRAALGTRRMILMQNIGNFGDALIRYGTLRFFEDLGLSFKGFDMERAGEKIVCLLTGMLDRLTDRYLFVYSGNGAWSPATNCAYRYVRRQRKFTRNLFRAADDLCHFPNEFRFSCFCARQISEHGVFEGRPFLPRYGVLSGACLAGAATAKPPTSDEENGLHVPRR